MSGPTVSLPANSAFSKDVYKLIRPSIPRAAWPSEAIRTAFTSDPDGYFLTAEFSGLPSDYAKLAGQLVRHAGGELVMASPLAGMAAAVARAHWWRDMCLFAFVPLLFAIPLMASLSTAAMRLCLIPFVADCVGLVLTQMSLSLARGRLGDVQFIAEIPTPSLHLRVTAESPSRGPHRG